MRLADHGAQIQVLRSGVRRMLATLALLVVDNTTTRQSFLILE